MILSYIGPSVEEILIICSVSTIIQDGRHAHIWLKKTTQKTLKNQESLEAESLDIA